LGTSRRTTHPPAHAGGPAKPPSTFLRLAAALVFAVVFLAFLRCLGSGFVDWDDTDNFLRNPHYRGVGAEQIRWMFTTFHMGHFQPLTWLTLGFDYTWAKAVLGNGMDARAYHFTNVLLHATNAVLFTFVALRLLAARTGQAASGPALVCAAAFAGLFFGAHPLRVESVAWVTERRDLLSSFFFLASVLFYLQWVRRARNRDPRAYALALGCFVLGLLSKVSVVVLPVVLLVIDAYPLGRTRTESWWRLLVEKAPFFVLSLVFGLIASFGQARHGWLSTLDQHPPAARLAQSAYGLIFYAWKTVLPFGLLPIYEMHFPVNPLNPRFVVAAILVVLAAAGIIAARRRLPGLAAAAVAYVIVLAPVIGIAQNGPQEVADRYSYISCMGWAILAAGACLAAWVARPSLGKPFLLAGALVIAGLGALTWRQCGVWRSTESLWTYTAARAPHSSIAQNGYGYVLLEQGRAAEAIPILRESLSIQPTNEKAQHNLWRALKETGDEEGLIAAYRDAIRVQPQLPDPYFNLGNALVRRNDLEGAIESYRTAVRLRPESAIYHGALAHALLRQGDSLEAEAECRRALALDPALHLARYDLALALEAQGRRAEAIAEVKTLLQQQPNNPEVRRLLDQLTGNR
jgi:Flp pilus assembly protein TadD